MMLPGILHENQRYYFYKATPERLATINHIKAKMPGTKYYYIRNLDRKTKKETYHFYLNKRVD